MRIADLLAGRRRLPWQQAPAASLLLGIGALADEATDSYRVLRLTTCGQRQLVHA